MNNDIENTIKRLNFENFIWFLFIIISILDIYGDELIKKNLRYNDKKAIDRANKVFLGVIFVSVLIYIYFFIRNYSDYKKQHDKNHEIRLIGSILILSGTICLLYFQLNNVTPNDSPSNI